MLLPLLFRVPGFILLLRLLLLPTVAVTHAIIALTNERIVFKFAFQNRIFDLCNIQNAACYKIFEFGTITDSLFDKETSSPFTCN